MQHTPESYRAEWSAKTGRSPAEVYVPEDIGRPALAVGTRIRILQDRLSSAKVYAGDVVTVVSAPEPGGEYFRTTAPRLSFDMTWWFRADGEGTGWERLP